MQSQQLDMYKLLESSLTVLNCTKGIIRFHNKCSKCKTKKHYKYFSALRCVSTVNVMHILLAKELGCNSFVTFDRGFEEIISHQLVQHIIIRVLT